MVVDAYGHWLAWLQTTEQLCPASPPASRVTRTRITAYHAYMQDRLAPITVQGRIGQLGRAMRAMAPEEDWAWLSRAACRLRTNAVPCRVKRPRMRDIEALVELGHDLMRRASATDGVSTIQHAALYRDGLMIALLALRPLRRRTFTAVTLGKHLTQRDGIWWLSFGAEDVKTKKDMEMPLPEGLIAPLQLYLNLYRPLLLQGRPKPGVTRPGTSAVWIAKGGRMMGASAISFQIRSRTEAAFGQSVNPHLFRDCAATSIAIRDPSYVRMILPILGHSTLATSERYYNQAKTIEASRRYQQQIATTRKSLANVVAGDSM